MYFQQQKTTHSASDGIKIMFSAQLFFKAVKNVCIISAFLFFIIVISVLVVPQKVAAIGLFTGFGGKILVVVPCDNGILITVGPPRPGVFLYSYYGLKKNFLLVPGVNVMGLASSYGVSVPCLVPPAEPVPSEGTIIVVGTSLLP